MGPHPARDARPAMISVLVADDQEIVRLGLRTLLDNVEGFSTVGEAADGLAAVAETVRTRPDVVLMDIRMPGIDGIEATRRIPPTPRWPPPASSS